MNAPLFKHQVESIRFFQDKEFALDASDPGTGKTRVQIEDFASRRRRGGGCALVVAPRSLLTSAWLDDFFRFAPDMRVSVATAKNRDRAFKAEADVYVTNTDAVKWISKQKKTFFTKFDTLIIDEIPAFKHHTSGRSKALNSIKQHFKWRRGLTGTLNANGIINVWHPMLILDNGARLGRSFFHFRSSVCIPEQTGPQANMVRWLDRPGAEQAVSGLIKDITIRHEFDNCIDIPPNYQYTVNFQMTLGINAFMRKCL